jgi:hypothetical protein
MRFLIVFLASISSATFAEAVPPSGVDSHQSDTINRIFSESLQRGRAYENLRALVTQSPGRLSGSKSLERAVEWANHALNGLNLDRVYTQEVMVPHWERGAQETVRLLSQGNSVALSAVALGGSVPTAAGGLTAEVVEVQSLDELAALGREKIAGKIVFFNRPMQSDVFLAGTAYRGAGDQRNLGPAAAARFGAVGALTRSLTHTLDDVPHTGNTSYGTDAEKIPAAALSTLAANQLSEALKSDPKLRVAMTINSHWFPDALSHNVIGEIRGSEFPHEIIVVGGHLDSWDIAPGAHDDGSGVVQSIETLRLFRTLGIKPRHTLRCVLFTSEENSLRGALTYAAQAKEKGEKHVFAIESDSGGFFPNGFEFDNVTHDAHVKAARWRSVFEPWGLWHFRRGEGGADVGPLLELGATVSELTPDSQRYFDYHHTTIDTLDKVSPRELQFGAAALASLIWLVDTEGL